MRGETGLESGLIKLYRLPVADRYRLDSLLVLTVLLTRASTEVT